MVENPEMATTKTCSKCRLRPPRPGQGYCTKCHSAYMKSHRAAKPTIKSLQHRLDAIQGLSSPWPLFAVLERLVNATEHLLDDHNCDAPGHEGDRIAVTRAKTYITQFNVSRETSTSPEK